MFWIYFHLFPFLSLNFTHLGTNKTQRKAEALHTETEIFLYTAVEQHSLPSLQQGRKGWTLNHALGGGGLAGCVECPKGWKINLVLLSHVSSGCL